MTIRPVSEGSAVVTVTAADPGGLTAVQTFTVTVDAPAAIAFTVSNIRRRQTAHSTSDWVYLDVLWNQRIDYWELELRFEHPDGFTRCFQRARNVLPGQFEEFTTSPEACGFRQQWYRVHITPAVDYSCEGCGTFERLSLPRW